MKLENILKKLNNQRGLTGADVVVSITVIVVTIAVITMIYLNINNNAKAVDRTAGATRIATNMLENMKLMNYADIGKNLSGSYQQEVSVSGGTIYNTKVPKGYTATITVNERTDAVPYTKNVKVDVKYKVGGDVQTVSMSNSFQKATGTIANNLPNYSVAYLNDLPDFEKQDESKEGGLSVEEKSGYLQEKIIVPIKYDAERKKYVTTTDDDPEWYNYSAKEWAKILVFEDAQTRNIFINSLGDVVTEDVTVADETKNFLDYVYVWIPNFGLGTDNSYYFKYGVGNEHNAIDFTEETMGGETICAYNIDEAITFQTGAGAVEMEAEGYWRKYTKTPEENTVYGIFNQTQYGPCLIHQT